MNNESLINVLKKLVVVDQQISRLTLQRNELAAKEASLNKQLAQASDKFAKAELALKELEKKNRLEEKRVLGLSEQISGRKKSLMSLGNYKLQDAAMREIDKSQQELTSAEDVNLLAMQTFEEKQLELITLEDAVKNIRRELAELQTSMAEQLDAISEREERVRVQRSTLTQGMDPKMLHEYDRQYERHAPDVISLIENEACSECAYSVAPKLLGEIQVGNTIVRCRGCGKILALE